ncbi:MAG TPA: FAD-linked oxidase C-terminal domain-containing protein, partial [Thermoplasmata archaeon]|nr:FAD-linked oxidase C-terminal domain-containing protein [Thermoplasmata archaeon]
NPGSWTVSTLGGNVATNAAGPRSFKYGSTRDWVLELEAVLGTGERIRVGGATRKRSVGPDLRALLVGSEGTLGLVTRIRVRLAPRPARRAALVVPLPPEARLGAVAEAIARWPGERVSAIEYLDTISADALAAEARGRIPSGSAVVLVELESASEEEETALLSSVADRLRALGVPGDPLVEPDADELWTLRGRSGPALDGRLGERIREDVAVPIDRIDALRESIDAIARRHGLEVAVFGHVGDGNLHPNFAIDPAGPAAASVRAELLASARALGGTISAEHGVGRLKRDHLPLELDAPSLALLRGLKRLCDPDGILNPGALLPDEPTAAPGADSGAGGSPSGGRGGRSRRASPTVRRGPRAAGHRRRRS